MNVVLDFIKTAFQWNIQFVLTCFYFHKTSHLAKS